MWQDKLKEIIYILENSNVNEIELTFWGRKFRVAKNPPSNSNNESNQPIQIIESDPEVQNRQFNDTKKSEMKVRSEKLENILSPMPGTFYSSPTPDDPPFISVGDTVKKGQILCIIEAMKIMNQIESDFDGEITDIKVDNGKPVEYNQVLFKIDPS